jgi:Spy/CpxP family protein refolding chaperone
MYRGCAGCASILRRSCFTRLNLTDAQREQVKSILEPRRESLQAHGRARAAHEALMAAITAEAFNEGLIRARAADVALVDVEVAVERGRVHADVLQILTADQKARLKELQAARPGRGRRPR